ncbi:citrate lyase [Mycobacteroides abscessus subsp. abscessus]|uniref:HpcH/HpaI aldolase/citrate lyase family protein n=1 Tax=Mycobacteroides abscessus TaxID=36809 RepID=UPI00066821BE|nr:CoA ester lyase [Mycobacteroides abscessus]AKP57224.1 aldolase [Mycobacteroides abscessus UC22]SHU53275.1 citrate lyase [Mycobacteroides abscessus subsp. abscessus]SHX63303.1 citrate lyase [Mycobacteroides abscessus subsp. abscessus]SIG94737.1 citrate lyase [Mycobacteroides abscessus subsp. abscessus]SKD19097.1 citrate lyase [Mycobacteroides abscessus subsp. abscessus]
MTGPESGIGWARSLLFVPGDRPERFAKAVDSGADAIVIDLEDAVAPDAKNVAREAAERWLREGGHAIVRINGSGTQWHADDVALAAACGCPVMLPKACSASHVSEVVAELPPGTELIALIETAAGVLAAPEICATDGVVRVAFGSIDLAAELGINPEEHESMLYARSALVMAAAAAGQATPVDGVTTTLNDADLLLADAARAARLGFGGKLCIHPRQVPAINAQFSPSQDEVAWARRVSAAVDGGASVVDGRMVDKPVVERAARILQRQSALAEESVASALS